MFTVRVTHVHCDTHVQCDIVSACNVSSCAEGEPESSAALTPQQREQHRVHKINEKKLHIASLGSAVISDPYSNVSLPAGLGSVNV